MLQTPTNDKKRKSRPINAYFVETPSPSKKTKTGSSMLLGLKTLKGGPNTEPFYSLHVGDILGRRKKVEDSSHKNLGITKDNGGVVISKECFQVVQVSDHSLELQPKTRGLKPISYERNQKSYIITPDSNVILQKDDILKFESHGRKVKVKNENMKCTFEYHYQVVPSSNNNDELQEECDTSSQLNTPRKSSTKKTNQKISSPAVDECSDLFTPFRPKLSMGHQIPKFKPPNKPPTTKAQSEDRSITKRTQIHDDSDEEEDEDEEDASFVPMMHATLANAYGKALQTSTPHVGATFLHTLLISGQLPTPQLLQEIVHLLTFGPSAMGVAFYDGCRLQLAFRYIRELLRQHPTVMVPRLVKASMEVSGADCDYLRCVMDQLSILPYVQDNVDKDQQQHQDLENSFQLHSFSLQFLLLLVQEVQNLPGESTTTLMKDLLGNKDPQNTVRTIAHVMSHVWVEHGNRMLWTGDDALFSNEVSDSLHQVTSYLSKIVGCLFSFWEDISEDSLLDILWNIMDDRLCKWEIESTGSKKYKKQYRIQLLLTWICSLELDACNNSDSSFATLPRKIAKRAKVDKPYRTLSAPN